MISRIILIFLLVSQSCLSQDYTRSLRDVFNETPIDLLVNRFNDTVLIYRKSDSVSNCLMYRCFFDSLGQKKIVEYYDSNNKVYKKNLFKNDVLWQTKFSFGDSIRYTQLKKKTGGEVIGVKSIRNVYSANDTLLLNELIRIDYPSIDTVIIDRIMLDSLEYDSLFYAFDKTKLKELRSKFKYRLSDSVYLEGNKKLCWIYDDNGRLTEVKKVNLNILPNRSRYDSEVIRILYSKEGHVQRVIFNNGDCYLYSD